MPELLSQLRHYPSGIRTGPIALVDECHTGHPIPPHLPVHCYGLRLHTTWTTTASLSSSYHARKASTVDLVLRYAYTLSTRLRLVPTDIATTLHKEKHTHGAKALQSRYNSGGPAAISSPEQAAVMIRYCDTWSLCCAQRRKRHIITGETHLRSTAQEQRHQEHAGLFLLRW